MSNPDVVIRIKTDRMARLPVSDHVQPNGFCQTELLRVKNRILPQSDTTKTAINILPNDTLPR